jgi:pyruvate, water dikinase
VTQIVWLDGSSITGVDPAEVGVRAAVLAQLLAGGVPVPRGFVLGRTLYQRFQERARAGDGLGRPTALPADVQREVAEAVRSLGGSFAIRRSPLDGATADKVDWMTTTLGGRPERETYLNLTDASEVNEAVRRIWATGQPIPIVVQRFMTPDVCALLRRDRADADVIHVASSLGVGDLLAAGLVVPDRHTLRQDGHVLACNPGRKAQMTVPFADGGVVRVPVPAHSARQLAMDDAKLAELAATWRSASRACDGLLALGVSWSAGRWWATSASAAAAAQEDSMLG